MQPLVSVIMPAYNAEQYVAEAIKSVLDQTYPNWELIVVDDGSTDGTARVVNEFANADRRVKYVFQENSQVGKARNTGLRNSAGPLVAFLDADDLWLKDKLELQVNTILNENVDLVFTECFVFEGDNVTDESTTFATPTGTFHGPNLLNALFLRNRLAILSVLVRREALTKVGFFEEGAKYQRCEDYDLWLKLARQGMVFHGMEKTLVRYRLHASAATRDKSRVLKPMIEVVRRYLDDVTVSGDEKRRRVRDLYRDLISALVEEGKLEEARTYMKELAAWDGNGLVTSVQRMLIAVWPRRYNFLSKEWLYRTEWHVNRILGRNSTSRTASSLQHVRGNV
jgi:teichuronic acid biosynthesis glycosyltransferase TuaG